MWCARWPCSFGRAVVITVGRRTSRRAQWWVVRATGLAAHDLAVLLIEVTFGAYGSGWQQPLNGLPQTIVVAIASAILWAAGFVGP